MALLYITVKNEDIIQAEDLTKARPLGIRVWTFDDGHGMGESKGGSHFCLLKFRSKPSEKVLITVIVSSYSKPSSQIRGAAGQ